MSSPSVDERPPKQCPPLRAATGSPPRRASVSASATSAAPRQRAMACGRRSSSSGIGGLRAASYSGERGWRRDGAKEERSEQEPLEADTEERGVSLLIVLARQSGQLPTAARQPTFGHPARLRQRDDLREHLLHRQRRADLDA